MKFVNAIILMSSLVTVNTHFASEPAKELMSVDSVKKELTTLVKDLERVNNELEVLGSKVRPKMPSQLQAFDRRSSELQSKKTAIQKQISVLRDKLNDEAQYNQIVKSLKK